MVLYVICVRWGEHERVSVLLMFCYIMLEYWSLGRVKTFNLSLCLWMVRCSSYRLHADMLATCGKQLGGEWEACFPLVMWTVFESWQPNFPWWNWKFFWLLSPLSEKLWLAWSSRPLQRRCAYVHRWASATDQIHWWQQNRESLPDEIDVGFFVLSLSGGSVRVRKHLATVVYPKLTILGL